MKRAETPVCLWRGCVPSAALTAALAPAHLPPTLFSPALLSRHARDPTGSHFSAYPYIRLKKEKPFSSSNFIFFPVLYSACPRMTAMRVVVTRWRARLHLTHRPPHMATAPTVT